jgi:hypothetical protein
MMGAAEQHQMFKDSTAQSELYICQGKIIVMVKSNVCGKMWPHFFHALKKITKFTNRHLPNTQKECISAHHVIITSV